MFSIRVLIRSSSVPSKGFLLKGIRSYRVPLKGSIRATIRVRV